MDGAPVPWWLMEENKEREAKTKTKYRDLSTAAASPPSVEMTWWVERASKSSGNDKGRVGREEGYIPTHRDETAMDGAPVPWWLMEENKEREAKTKTKYRDLSTAAASPPSVEMTWWVERASKSNGNDKSKVGWEEGYIPTHRGETAMDGHPFFGGWWKRTKNGKQKQRRNTGISPTAAASPPSVEMTFVAWGVKTF